MSLLPLLRMDCSSFSPMLYFQMDCSSSPMSYFQMDCSSSPMSFSKWIALLLRCRSNGLLFFSDVVAPNGLLFFSDVVAPNGLLFSPMLYSERIALLLRRRTPNGLLFFLMSCSERITLLLRCRCSKWITLLLRFRRSKWIALLLRFRCSKRITLLLRCRRSERIVALLRNEKRFEDFLPPFDGGNVVSSLVDSSLVDLTVVVPNGLLLFFFVDEANGFEDSSLVEVENGLLAFFFAFDFANGFILPNGFDMILQYSLQKMNLSKNVKILSLSLILSLKIRSRSS